MEMAQNCNQWRLLVDSRVVEVTLSSNPMCASCILLEAIIFQEPSYIRCVLQTHMGT